MPQGEKSGTANVLLTIAPGSSQQANWKKQNVENVVFIMQYSFYNSNKK